MIQHPKPDRRFHRIQLDAVVRLTTSTGTELVCQCIDFSEDGIDLKIETADTNFTDYDVGAGTIVMLNFSDIPDSPQLKAAVIKAASKRLGLRIIH